MAMITPRITAARLAETAAKKLKLLVTSRHSVPNSSGNRNYTSADLYVDGKCQSRKAMPDLPGQWSTVHSFDVARGATYTLMSSTNIGDGQLQIMSEAKHITIPHVGLNLEIPKMAAEDWFDPFDELDTSPDMNGGRFGSYLDQLVGRTVKVRLDPSINRIQEVKVGEYADEAIDRMIFGPMDKYDAPEKLRKSTFQHGVGNYKWRRRDGQVIDMHDMEDEYLANCIRICDEMGNTGKKEQLEAVLKARQSVYTDSIKSGAVDPTKLDEKIGKRIGQSTSWPVPAWVFDNK